MQWWEVQRYINGISRRHRTAWLTTRQLGWWVARLLGAKVETPQDLCQLSFEVEPVLPANEPDEEQVQAALELIRSYNEKVNPRP